MDSPPEKKPSTARMGKAAELLVAAHCILASSGRLNVSTSYVDDEGVDLVFHARGSAATLAVQVKTRFTTSSTVRDGVISTEVRQQTFAARDDLAMLFVVIDDAEGRILQTWLVPSRDFQTQAALHGPEQKLRFRASTREGSNDKWSPYRLTPADLPREVLKVLADLERSGH